MASRNRFRRRPEDSEPLLTPMIDVVFLLLVFFLLTFQIVSPEGDFDVKMPQAGLQAQRVSELPPLTVFLRARPDGQLADIRFGNRSLGTDFQKLRMEIRQFTGDGLTASTDPVKLDCDYQLKYEYLIEAVTAVSGYVDEGQIVTLFDKIQLAPPRKPG